MNANLIEANSFYRKSQEDYGVSNVLRESYLRKALKIYNEEIKNVTTAENKASLMKNLGMTNLKLAEVLSDADQQPKLLLYHLAEAVGSFCQSYVWKNSLGPVDAGWADRIGECVTDCFYLAFRSVDGDVKTHRIAKLPLLHKLYAAIGLEKLLDTFRIAFLIGRARFFLCCGVTAMDDKDFKTTLQMVEYGREDMELAFKYAKDANRLCLQDDIKGVQADHAFLRHSCESIRMRFQADQLFEIYVKQAEEVNFDMMWEVLDMYKDAALKTREKDVENEAIALSRQGRMFDKIFKLKAKAHSYYRRAFDLAHLFPRNFNKVDWFMECKEALDRYQQDILKAEDEKEKKEKGPILEKLSPVLKEIKTANDKSAFQLLAHVYSKHPPKVPHDYVEKNVNADNLKKTIMKAIRLYHPDKQSRFGIEWQVLCEEITKCLTVRYEGLKGLD